MNGASASPVMIFAIGIEHALDVTVQGSHRTYPREHRWPMSPWQTSAARGGLKPSRPPSHPTIETASGRRLAAPAITRLSRPLAAI
jgi:hypothetical protein